MDVRRPRVTASLSSQAAPGPSVPLSPLVLARDARTPILHFTVSSFAVRNSAAAAVAIASAKLVRVAPSLR